MFRNYFISTFGKYTYAKSNFHLWTFRTRSFRTFWFYVISTFRFYDLWTCHFDSRTFWFYVISTFRLFDVSILFRPRTFRSNFISKYWLFDSMSFRLFEILTFSHFTKSHFNFWTFCTTVVSTVFAQGHFVNGIFDFMSFRHLDFSKLPYFDLCTIYIYQK